MRSLQNLHNLHILTLAWWIFRRCFCANNAAIKGKTMRRSRKMRLTFIWPNDRKMKIAEEQTTCTSTHIQMTRTHSQIECAPISYMCILIDAIDLYLFTWNWHFELYSLAHRIVSYCTYLFHEQQRWKERAKNASTKYYRVAVPCSALPNVEFIFFFSVFACFCLCSCIDIPSDTFQTIFLCVAFHFSLRSGLTKKNVVWQKH